LFTKDEHIVELSMNFTYSMETSVFIVSTHQLILCWLYVWGACYCI